METIRDYFEGLYYKIIRIKQQIKNFFFWGWFMKDTLDYDAHSIYPMLHYKLKSVYNYMKKDSHLMWNSSTKTNGMRKLAELSELARKLYEEDYSYRNNVRRVMDNYECPRTIASPIYSLVKRRKPRKMISNDLYKFYFKMASKRDKKEYETVKNRFYYLLNKYVEHFWD